MKRTVATVSVVAMIVAVALVGVTIAADTNTGDAVASVTRPYAQRFIATADVTRPMPHPLALPSLTALSALVLAGVAMSRRSGALIGPRLRRIGDPGDDWRALLRGAPPRSVDRLNVPRPLGPQRRINHEHQDAAVAPYPRDLSY